LIASTLRRWAEIELGKFAEFNGDPVAAINAELAAAGPRSVCLPILICADGNVQVRLLSMIKARLEKRLDCEDALIAALLDGSEAVRRTAASALLDLDTIRGLAAIVAGDRHGHGIRTRAAYRLQQYGPNAAPAIPSLFRLIDYSNINWRSHMAAAIALAAIGDSALPYLIHAVRSGSPSGKDWATSSLHQRGDYSDLPEDVVGILKKYAADLEASQQEEEERQWQIESHRRSDTR